MGGAPSWQRTRQTEESRVDVTQILASAGVLGLAVAFGAQELIRDSFCGFFILLENHYGVGDLVVFLRDPERDRIQSCFEG